MNTLIAFILSIIASSVGNLILKTGMMKMGGITLSKQNLITEIFKVFTNPFILIGLFGYVFGFFLWLRVLSTTEVSRAYPVLVSTTIILVLLGSLVFIKEQLSFLKFIGVLVIIIGIFLDFKN